MPTLRSVRRARGLYRLPCLAVLLCLACCGCADFWEEVTSRDFKFKDFYTSPDPLVVLRDSTDGDKRAAALRALREPNLHGGTDKDQDMVVHLLATAAVTERQPLCRLAAIETLGHFKDPRAAQALKDAFYSAGSFPHSSTSTVIDAVYSTGGPSPDIITRIQCQALTALGETGNPAAIELLVRVVKEPRGEGDQENQETMDRRIAAAKALGKFKNREAELALVQVLEKEKDVALRDRVNEALQTATGQKLPPDPKVWTAMLNGQPTTPGSPEATKATFMQTGYK